MTRIYVPSAGPDSWREFLADPDLHWKTGYSARTLAHCWESAEGVPPEIAACFQDTPDFADRPELLAALPEHKVRLPGGARDSQNDVFALVRCAGKTIATTIEGKVSETFGPTIAEWYRAPSPGKQQRLAYLCELLGVACPPPGALYYQLFHRAASAVIEAQRFKTDAAAMIVHSFSPNNMWRADYEAFVMHLGGAKPARGLTRVTGGTGVALYTAWVSGDPQFLTR